MKRSFELPIQIFFFKEGKQVSLNGHKYPERQHIINCINSLKDLLKEDVKETEDYNKNIDEYLEKESHSYTSKVKKPLPMSGWVYVYKQGKYYKIGRSQKEDCRRTKYITENPIKISLICKFKCGDYILAEETLHKYFSEKRSNREWYLLNKEDIKNIPIIIKNYLC